MKFSCPISESIVSGSPIVQNGKLIGAVTHVISSDPMKGYGVYIDWMLENTKQ